MFKKKLLEEKILKELKDKIVLVGTKEAKILKSSLKFEKKSKIESKTKQNLKDNNTQKEQAPSSKKPSSEVVAVPKENPETAPTSSDKEKTYKPIHGIAIIPNKYKDKFKTVIS